MSKSEKRESGYSSSILTGVYEFIPLPFIDDTLINKERQKMVRRILEKRQIRFEPKAVETLAGSGATLLGRLGGLAKGAIMKPARKIFRTFFIWFTVRRAARNAIVTHVLARFLSHPKLHSTIEGGYVDQVTAKRLAKIFASVSKNLDLKLLRRAVVGLMKFPFRKSGARAMDEQIERKAPGFYEEVDQQIAAALSRG